MLLNQTVFTKHVVYIERTQGMRQYLFKASAIDAFELFAFWKKGDWGIQFIFCYSFRAALHTLACNDQTLIIRNQGQIYTLFFCWVKIHHVEPNNRARGQKVKPYLKAWEKQCSTQTLRHTPRNVPGFLCLSIFFVSIPNHCVWWTQQDNTMMWSVDLFAPLWPLVDFVRSWSLYD